MLELRADASVLRLLTCHFTHWTAEQLLWDGVAFAALALVCERRDPKALLAMLLTGIVAVPLAVLLFAPNIAAYRGLSGLASGCFALVLVEGRPSRLSSARVLHAAIAIGFAGKIAFELSTGGTLFVTSMGPGVVSVPVAHVAGALVGLCIGLVRIAVCTPSLSCSS
jgi:rhomboid family GlyGly-CTERM serine protease